MPYSGDWGHHCFLLRAWGLISPHPSGNGFTGKQQLPVWAWTRSPAGWPSARGPCSPLPPKCGQSCLATSAPRGKAKQPVKWWFCNTAQRGILKESNKLPVCISHARWSMAAAGRNHTVQLLLLPKRKLQNHCLINLTGKEAALALLEGEVTKLQSKCGSFKLSEWQKTPDTLCWGRLSLSFCTLTGALKYIYNSWGWLALRNELNS